MAINYGVTMKEKVKGYVGAAIALIFLRLIYVLITHKPYFEDVFVFTFIGTLVGLISIDIIQYKQGRKNKR